MSTIALDARISKFLSSLKSTASATATLAFEVIEHGHDHGDVMPMQKLYGGVKAVRPREAKSLEIFLKEFAPITITREDKIKLKHKHARVWKRDEMAGLRARLQDGKLSDYADLIREARGEKPVPAAKPYDFEGSAKRLAKKWSEAGATEDECARLTGLAAEVATRISKESAEASVDDRTSPTGKPESRTETVVSFGDVASKVASDISSHAASTRTEATMPEVTQQNRRGVARWLHGPELPGKEPPQPRTEEKPLMRSEDARPSEDRPPHSR